MNSDLTDKHIVVTGGTGELGRAVVEALVAAGATCHVPHRANKPPSDLVAALGLAGERLHLVGDVDLTSEPAVTSFYARLPTLWGSVHAAGGFAAAEFANTALVDLRFQLDINLTTSFLCCREAVRKMTTTGGGRIVNVASRAALEPKGGAIAYSIAKAGVATMTQCLADEVKSRGILVNAVVPSTIDTPANRRAMPNARHDLWPKPAQIAETIVWLCHPQTQLVSGALLPVYGQV